MASPPLCPVFHQEHWRFVTPRLSTGSLASRLVTRRSVDRDVTRCHPGHHRVPPRNGTGCHPRTVQGVTQDTTSGATRYTTGCDSKRYELPTVLPLGSLRDANRSVARDTTGYQLGVLPATRRVDFLSVGGSHVSLHSCVRSRMMLSSLMLSWLLLFSRMSLLLLSFAVSISPRRVDTVFVLFYRSIDAMLTMVNRRYRLGGMSAIAAGKCTDTAHHSGSINARRTRVGGHIRSVVRCFKVKSLWLDT